VNVSQERETVPCHSKTLANGSSFPSFRGRRRREDPFHSFQESIFIVPLSRGCKLEEVARVGCHLDLDLDIHFRKVTTEEEKMHLKRDPISISSF